MRPLIKTACKNYVPPRALSTSVLVGGATLIGGDEGEARRWRSGVEGASAVVEISAGGSWTRLCLYGVGR